MYNKTPLFFFMVAMLLAVEKIVHAASGFTDMAHKRTLWISDGYAFVYDPRSVAIGEVHFPGQLSLWAAISGASDEMALEGNVLPTHLILDDVDSFAFASSGRILIRTHDHIYEARLADIEGSLRILTEMPEDKRVLEEVEFVNFPEYMEYRFRRSMLIGAVVVTTLCILFIFVHRICSRRARKGDIHNIPFDDIAIES